MGAWAVEWMSSGLLPHQWRCPSEKWEVSCDLLGTAEQGCGARGNELL